MLLFYIVLFCFMLIGMKVSHSGFYEDFLGRRQTNAVKGLFIWMVFLSHALLNVSSSGFQPLSAFDVAGFNLRSELGQLIIVPFLFYSGFGVKESIKNKGKEYIDRFPRRRLLTTLLNFDVAVLYFIVLNWIMGVHMGLKQIAGSLIGWDTVGNSNWYIFVILYCYLVSWISVKVFSEDRRKALVMTTLLVLLGEAALSFFKHGQAWWYNTLLCYPAGMVFSFYKDRIISFFKRYYLSTLLLTVTLFLFLHLQKWIPPLRGLTFNLESISFAILVVLLTMKVKTGNRLLYWSGICVFPIYIYQRLPMRAFQHWAGKEAVCANPYLFILLCAVITGGIAYYYKHWQIKLQ